MDDQAQAAQTPQAVIDKPAMDVVPPRNNSIPQTAAPAEEPVAEPPKEESAASANDQPKPPSPQATTTASPKRNRANTPKNGVTAAIFATVIIVLGLAALATYAYLKQQNQI